MTCALLVVSVMLIIFVIATRRTRMRHAATRHVLSAIDAALSSLPADIKRNTPLILTIGDTRGAVADAFASDLVRITDTAIWIRSDDPAQLMHLADALKRWRNGQGPDAIAYLISADKTDSRASFTASAKHWRSAISEASRAVGYRLPVCVAIYLEVAHPASDECSWFGVSGAEPVQIGALTALVALRVDRYSGVVLPMNRELRAYRSAQLVTLTHWACDAVLPALVEAQRGSHPLSVTAFGVMAVTGRTAPNSMYGQFVTRTSGLTFATSAGEKLSYPLPEPLIQGIALQPVRRALPRALAHAFVWLMVCFCAAAAASAWQNYALVERITGHMARYRSIAPIRDAARVDALKAVKDDRDELERYARSGVPPRLGLGFYRGAPLLPLANELIASYYPPAPPPSTIELDSLSLFRTGSAVLNPGSNRVLVGALEIIKTHPGKRVLVAGHTDSVGNPDSNLKLSEARATSVRDWLADASGIPASHFAIQGYGDTRPKAVNDTEIGRAANRRVEITLVPDCRDIDNDHGNPSTPGHPACS